MAELVYSAGLTSKLFWLQESRKTAGYILDGYSKADIRKIAWEENIYQVKAEYRAYCRKLCFRLLPLVMWRQQRF